MSSYINVITKEVDFVAFESKTCQSLTHSQCLKGWVINSNFRVFFSRVSRRSDTERLCYQNAMCVDTTSSVLCSHFRLWPWYEQCCYCCDSISGRSADTGAAATYWLTVISPGRCSNHFLSSARLQSFDFLCHREGLYRTRRLFKMWEPICFSRHENMESGLLRHHLMSGRL